MNRSALTVERALWWGPGLALVLILVLAPLLFTDFYLSQVITKALWLGIAAASLIFLAAYVGMVSLGQVALYGVAGFTMANVVEADGGSTIAWNPWVATLAGILVAVGVGLFFGAMASRSYGIYFLMITLAVAVLTYYFFAQVTELSGFGGVNNVARPGIVSNPVTDPRTCSTSRSEPLPPSTSSCATWREHRSASRCRAFGTTRPGCARSDTTSRFCACSRSASERSSPRSPGFCPSGGTHGSRPARSTYRARSTCS